MRLGFCSNAYTRFGLEEAIAAVAGHGFAGVELLCDRPHYWPADDRDRKRAKSLARTLREHAVAASNINANTAIGFYGETIPESVFGPSLCSADEAEVARRLAHIGGALELATATGASCVSVTSGAPGDDLPPERALHALHESLQKVLELADATGVRIGLEAEPGLLLETSAEVAAVIDRMGHPLLGFNLDVGHAVVIGEDPAAVIDAHADRIWHLHLEDIAGRKHFHRIPGDGDVDFDSIAGALSANGFDGFASVEVYPYKSDPDAAARASYSRLSPLFDRATR